MNNQQRITIIGSSNIDMVAQVPHLPKPGETVGNAIYMQSFGGKGANQAVAAARLGGNITFVTSLGNDMYATLLTEHFKNNNIDTHYIQYSSDTSTGTALIFVSDDAENCIAVAPGANAELSIDKIQSFEAAVISSSIVIMQAEIPYETIKEISLLAHKKGVKVMVNPAPAVPIDLDFMKSIDILVVNETEAEIVSGLNIKKDGIKKISQELSSKGPKCVVVTLGSKGVYCLCHQKEYTVDSFKVKAIDTTGAGDTFCGALAIALAENEMSIKALQYASAVAAISVTRMGAQPSIPYKEEVIKFLKEQNINL